MKTNDTIKIRFYPFLYLLWFFVVMYSIEDMATSTNAYQQQGDRSGVYIYLIGILGVLGIYYLSNFKLYTFAPMTPLLFMAIWVFADNLFLGNFYGGSRWTALTHFGLVVWWYLAIVFGYNYVSNNRYKEKQTTFLILAMFIYYCYKFIEVAIVSNETHDETTVLNLIYRVIVFIPILSLLENKWLKNATMAMIFILTVISMKRGALIVLPAMILVGSVLDKTKKKNIVKTIFSAIVIVVFAVVVIQVINNMTGGFLAERFSWESLTEGSSRSEKYAVAIETISQRNFLQFMVGIGSGPRPGVHNEILEFLVTFGFIGFCTYAAMFVSMLRRLKKLYNERSKYAAVYGMIFVFIFMVGLYSGVCFTHSTFYIMLTLGIVERRIAEERSLYV